MSKTAAPDDRDTALGQMRLPSSEAACRGISDQARKEMLMNPYDDWSSPLFKGGAIIFVEDFIKRAGIDEVDVDTMLAAGLGQDGYIENNRRGLLVRTLPSREDLEALGLRPRADYTPEFFWGPEGPSYDGWYMQWD